MNLLLVSATHFEISETASWLENHSRDLNVLKPKLLISGIGQLQTAYRLQKSIASRRPQLVIQAGVGGFTSANEISNVYAIGSDRIDDLGLLEKAGFSSIFEMGLEPASQFPFQNEQLVNPYRLLLDWSGLPLSNGITVNEIKSADLPFIQRNSGPVVESMEGAALHYVCLMEKIPFLQIRAISNLTGDRDKSRWRLRESLVKLNEVLVDMIQKLEKADETLFRI